MNLWQRMKIAGRVLTRGADDDMPDGIKPPARASVCDPLSLSTVFRGVQVLQTAITGLPIHEMRGGVKLDTVSSLVLQPDVNRSRRDFLADMVASMVIDGNAFVHLVRFGGDIVSCEVLPPALVVVSDDGSDPAAPKLRYSYLGKDYTANDIVHCKFLNVPGRLRGLGPLSAAREEVEGAQMARDYKAKFYTDSSNIEQSWIEFADYTLAAYTGEIEELFNRLLPRGRTAAFDWDSSRRADMSDRYAAYASALGAGWMDVNEIRAREALPPKIAAPQPEGVNNEA